MRSKELIICGLKNVRSRFETNSNSIRRLFFNRAMAHSLGSFCRWMAQERLVYRCVETEELEAISGTVHHGGVVVVVDAPELRSPHVEEIRDWAKKRLSVLALDRIGNVHNLGAIIRTAAYFGVSKLIIPDHPQAAQPTDATYRVAEGGLDHVDVFCAHDFPSVVRMLREFYFVIGAATRGGNPDFNTRSDRPRALILGNEETGLDQEIAALCHSLATIPGTGQVESLNVSAAAAILLWEISRSGSGTESGKNR